MRKALVIARHEYLANVRRTGFIIMTALVPILGLLALLVATFFGGQAESFLERQFAMGPGQTGAIGVVDGQGSFSPIMPAYQDRFHLFPDEQTGRQAVRDGEIASLLVIPPDYVASGRVTMVSKEAGVSAAMMEGAARLRAFFVDHLVRDHLDQALRERLAAPYDYTLVSLEGDGQAGIAREALAINAIAGYVLGLLLVMTIFVSSGYLLRSVSEEKTTRVIEIVLSSVTATQLLAGKVLGLGTLGLTQVVIWLLSAFALSRAAEVLLDVSMPLVARPEILLMGLVYYLLGFLVYAVLIAGVGALGTTEQESQQLAGIFSLLAALPLMVGGMVFTNPNMMLLRVLSWFPLTAPTMMLLRFPMAEVPLVDVVGSIVVLIVFIPVFLLAGARVFRMGLLMYGKRPGLRQVVRALRQA